MRVLVLFSIFLFGCSNLERTRQRIPAQISHCSKTVNRFQSEVLSKNFPVFSLLSHLKGENNKVTYLSEKGRLEYQAFVDCEGKIVDFEGSPISSPSNEVIVNPVKAIFVVDTKGRLFLSFYHPIGVFHHSSLVGGDDVLVAGEMILVDGNIELINNHSGHYHPNDRSLDLLLDVLISLNVKINRVD